MARTRIRFHRAGRRRQEPTTVCPAWMKAAFLCLLPASVPHLPKGPELAAHRRQCRASRTGRTTEPAMVRAATPRLMQRFQLSKCRLLLFLAISSRRCHHRHRSSSSRSTWTVSTGSFRNAPEWMPNDSCRIRWTERSSSGAALQRTRLTPSRSPTAVWIEDSVIS